MILPGTSSSYSYNYCPSSSPSSSLPNPCHAMAVNVLGYFSLAWNGVGNFTNEALVAAPCLHDLVCAADLPALYTVSLQSFLTALYAGLPCMYVGWFFLTCGVVMWGYFCVSVLITKLCLNARSKQECLHTQKDLESQCKSKRRCRDGALVKRVLRLMTPVKFLPARRVSAPRRLKSARLGSRRRAQFVRGVRGHWWRAGRLPRMRRAQSTQSRGAEYGSQQQDVPAACLFTRRAVKRQLRLCKRRLGASVPRLLLVAAALLVAALLSWTEQQAPFCTGRGSHPPRTCWLQKVAAPARL